MLLFQNIAPTGKSFLLAVDISGSMQYGSVHGTPQLKPMQVAATLLMSIAHSEQQYTMLVFSDPIKTAPLNKDKSLQELCHSLGEVGSLFYIMLVWEIIPAFGLMLYRGSTTVWQPWTVLSPLSGQLRTQKMWTSFLW
jgi:hypothetical protein